MGRGLFRVLRSLTPVISPLPIPALAAFIAELNWHWSAYARLEQTAGPLIKRTTNLALQGGEEVRVVGLARGRSCSFPCVCWI